VVKWRWRWSCLAWGIRPGQLVPKDFPDRTTLAYAAAAFMFRGVPPSSASDRGLGRRALTAYTRFIVVILMDGRVVLTHYARIRHLQRHREQLAITAGGLIGLRRQRQIDAAGRTASPPGPTGVRGVCALLSAERIFST